MARTRYSRLIEHLENAAAVNHSLGESIRLIALHIASGRLTVPPEAAQELARIRDNQERLQALLIALRQEIQSEDRQEELSEPEL
jgi:hypothetical protein